MNIKLHKQATTTPKIRADIQAAPAGMTNKNLTRQFEIKPGRPQTNGIVKHFMGVSAMCWRLGAMTLSIQHRLSSGIADYTTTIFSRRHYTTGHLLQQ